ncbi:DegQ family serine endoprotease [Larsenimonas rhizosphaerae]|uniref:Probable periplasmic serine endoprotease DegP-like n=1 Tax=Larsenimonas rhizosphaerae TaxID=2944682 RepID=A0AA42CXA0_9GAMM|nr:DegQ family serine endoprotease [Larsenimonas rhizosphaerae]MCX2523640.1 DegQ family serine endoprotease [Larsenimonas rhizosphaerae]
MDVVYRRMSTWLMATVFLIAAHCAQAAAPLAQLPDFTGLVKSAAPAVVNISTTREVNTAFSPFEQQQLPDIFRHFFGDQFPPGAMGPQQPRSPGGPRPKGRELSSLGSGFIISKDGYILTNAHVIDGADTIKVRLNDRRELTGKLIGEDKKTDVALIKVDATDLPTLDMGDSDSLEVGQWVVAIGSPFGFDHSVTSGIVSAIDRTLPDDTYVPFIQTDVAINPGNSGGPLFNLNGQVIGINSQIYTRSGGFMGLSFAIPINVAMDIADQLKKDGQVHRGWLGVVIQPVSRDLARSFGLDQETGALVADVAPTGPARKAGLKAGDIILEANGETVDSSDELPRIVGHLTPGDTLSMKVLRNGHHTTLKATVADWPKDESSSIGDSADEQRHNSLGLQVTPLTDALKGQLSVDRGVVVESVDPDGAGARAGIQPGDVITSLNGKAVDDVAALEKAVGHLPAEKPVPLRISRDGQPLFVAITLPKK